MKVRERILESNEGIAPRLSAVVPSLPSDPARRPIRRAKGLIGP